jgi:3-methyl-2-oxobutanoate hydroxymethyltransferase
VPRLRLFAAARDAAGTARDEVPGRTVGEVLDAAALVADAAALVAAGAFAVVLELVTPPVAKELTDRLPIPTIGIGSGPDCDGQILVTHDLVGAFPWFTPRFVTPKARTGEAIQQAVLQWINELR